MASEEWGGARFAEKLSQYLVARGYRRVAGPELETLAAACDDLLVMETEAETFLAAIVDRDLSHNGRRVPVAAIAQGLLDEAALAFPGRALTLRFFEVGASIEVADRLDAYRSSNGRIQSWLIDVPLGGIWTSARHEKQLRREVDALLRVRKKELRAAQHLPPLFFTYGLIALLVALFGVEVALSSTYSPRPLSLTAFDLRLLGGANGFDVIKRWQVWRLFTAPLLHAGLNHLFFNCLALLLVSRLLEAHIGWRWTATIFALAALAGSVTSLLVNPIYLVSVGASGGIIGLCAAALILCVRMPRGKLRNRLIRRSVASLSVSVVPFFFTSALASGVDYADHLGGAIAGVIVGAVLLVLWPKGRPQPAPSHMALVPAAAFTVVAAFGALPVGSSFLAIFEQSALVPAHPTSATPKARVPSGLGVTATQAARAAQHS